MAYVDQWGLWNDAPFQGRLTACVSQEATNKTGDALADAVLQNPYDGMAWFLPFVTSAQDIIDFYADPNGGGSVNVPDQAILSNVQADWATVAGLHTSP